MTHSCFYEGWVRHRRFAPTPHEFRYPLFLTYLDLAEIDVLDGGLWSTKSPALAWYRRADYLGDPERPLDECVRELVRQRLGKAATGPVRMLAHVRYFGLLFNPVTFYWCFGADDRVEAIVAEVRNTPWNERHCYVLDPEEGRAGATKAFHVSPFLPMDLDYRFALTSPSQELVVHIDALRGATKMLDATLRMSRVQIRPSSRLRMLIRYPVMTGQVLAAIHFEALRLWRKKTPYFPHP
jgi:DUF1365 family protein